jgi:hypothetical protein
VGVSVAPGVSDAVGVGGAVGEAVGVKVVLGGRALPVGEAVAVTFLGNGITGRVAGSRLQVTEPAETQPTPAPSARRTSIHAPSGSPTGV